MATFVTVKENIFHSKAEVLVNPVNCVGTMGAGLAKQFKLRYPDLDRRYRAACQSGLVKPGTVRLYRVSDTTTVANLPTKDHWRQPSHLKYVETGLESLNQALEQGEFRSVAVPALGAGLGGLNWAEVEPLIRSILRKEGLTVEIYPPR